MKDRDLADEVEKLVEENRQLGERARFLERAIRDYLERPGCNIVSRGNAVRKLRWALEQS